MHGEHENNHQCDCITIRIHILDNVFLFGVMHEASQPLYGVRVNDNFHVLAAWTWLGSLLIINQN